MRLSQETKFGYGFLLAGVGVPYLIDKLVGSLAALIIAALCTVLGCGLLAAGHLHREKESIGFGLPQRRVLPVIITTILLLAMAVSLVWAIERYIKAPTEIGHAPSIATVPKEHHATPTLTMTEWGAERGNKVYAVVKIESPPPSNAPFRVMLVTRVQDSSKDEMEDTTIEKSTTLPMAGQTIELGVTQDFLQRAHQWKFVRVILVLLPSTAQSDQISKLSDVLKVGGQIAVNNSFVMQSSQRNIYQGGHRPTTDDIVTQKGRNNIFQHGNNNQASINETTPTVQSAVLEVRWLCRVRPDAEMPLLSNRDFSMMRATAGLFSGSIPPVRLSVLSPIHQQQGSDGRLEVIETFAMPPQSGWIGKAIDSLPTISKVAADILGITFYDCSEPISGESITLSINGTGVWRTSRFSTLPATDGMFVVSADVDTWPSKDQLIKKLAP